MYVRLGIKDQVEIMTRYMTLSEQLCDMSYQLAGFTGKETTFQACEDEHNKRCQEFADFLAHLGEQG